MKALVLSSGGVDSTTCLGLAIEKYGKEIDKITLEYLNNGDVELFRQRILFFISRRVYYNVFASNNKIAKWDVAGITANYNLLSHEIKKKIMAILRKKQNTLW